jgi:hypothetical protein
MYENITMKFIKIVLKGGKGKQKSHRAVNLIKVHYMQWKYHSETSLYN